MSTWERWKLWRGTTIGYAENHRVLRLMGAHGLLAPSRVGPPRGPRGHDGTIVPATVDTLWSPDLTTA